MKLRKPQRKLSSRHRSRPGLLLVSWALLSAAQAFADSATWSGNPGTGDWNTSANWVGGTVPNGAANVATFDLSSVTGISVSANTLVSSIVFNAGASAYAITASPTFTLSLSGAGIINNSGSTQSFVAAVNGTSGLGIMIFSNTATAGTNTAFAINGATTSGASGGDIEFRDSSDAGGGSFTLSGSAGGAGGGIVGFSDTASAANGVFVNNGPAPGGGSGTGYLEFHGTATAANSTVTNNAGPSGFTGGGTTVFYSNSTAGNGNFTNNGGNASNAFGQIYFNDTSSAGSATFTNNGGSGATNATGGVTVLGTGSTMGSATFINNGAGSSGAIGGTTSIYTLSTTGSGTFINNGGAITGTAGGATEFNSANGGSTTVSAGSSTFTNNGGTAASTGGGFTEFWYSTAGNATFINNGGSAGSGAGGGLVKFYYSASAGNATFTNYAGTVSGANGGAVVFDTDASAGHGAFINQGSAVSGASAGSTQFFSYTLAGQATITNNGGTGTDANGADTDFYNFSNAESSTIVNNGGTVSGAKGGSVQFKDNTTAANATVTANAGTAIGALGGTTQFLGTAAAGNSTLIANGGTGGGGAILFSLDATGGTARVKVFGNGNLDISQHNSPGVTIGSLEGSGNVFLGASTLTVGSNNVSTTLSGVIQDGGVTVGTGGSLTKIGSSTLTLTGTNTFTGATTVNGGTLVADTAVNSSVLNSSSTLVVGGGAFQLKGNSGTQSQTLSGLTINAGASIVDVNNLGTSTTLDLGSTMTHVAGGTVDFKASSGTLGTNAVIKTTQANVNGIIGAWATVNGGAAFATQNASNAIVAYTGYTSLDAQGGGSNATIANTPILNYGINAAGTSGSVALAATTTTINTLTQNFSTAATIDTGTTKILRVGASGGIFITPTSASLTIGTAANAGKLTAGGNVTNGAGELILANFSTGGTLTINSTVAINGTGVISLTKSGSGLVVLNGTNTFTGGTTLNAGTLKLGNVSALGTAARTLKLTGGTLDLATDTTVNAWPTTITSSASILSDKATASSAGITHTLGILGIGTQTLSIGAGANVATDSNFGLTFGATTLSGDTTFNVANNGAGVGTLTLGRVTDGGIRTITKTGVGTLVLGTGASGTSITYGTSLIVNNGIAQVNAKDALGSASLFSYASVNVNATTAGTTAEFRLNNAVAISQKIISLTFGGTGGTSTSTNNVQTGISTLNLDGNVTYDATGNPLGSTLSGILGLGDSRVFTVGDSSNADADLTISANITGSTTSGIPSITKVGAGTLILTGANTFNQGISVNAGVLSLDTLPASTTGPSTVGTGTVQFAGGKLRYTGATLSTSHLFGVITGGGGIEITQSGTVLNISSAFKGEGDGLVSDALVKSGPGTLVLSGTTDNVGLDVTVNAGLLQLSKTSSSTKHAVSKNLVVNGGTAQLGTAGSGSDQIENDATVTVNAGGTFDFNGKNETFDSLSGGGGSVTNTGTADSTMTLGANNYLTGTTTFGGVISDGATKKMLLTKTGRGIQILTGANTYTGTTTISGGTLQIGAGGSTGSIAGASIVDNATLAFNRTGTLTYGGVISGSGALNKSGAGSLTLTGTNTYTGLTTVALGTMIVNGSIAGAATVQSGGILGGSGRISGDVIVMDGGRLSPGNSPGKITLLQNLTLNDGSTLLMEIGGTGAGLFDQVDVHGSFTAGGTLNLLLVNGFIPTSGNSFLLFNAGGINAGAFTSITTNLGNGLTWDTSQLAATGVISVMPVPEPSTWALLGVGLFSLLAFRRRTVR